LADVSIPTSLPTSEAGLTADGVIDTEVAAAETLVGSGPTPERRPGAADHPDGRSAATDPGS
jgi:hypothetical protein